MSDRTPSAPNGVGGLSGGAGTHPHATMRLLGDHWIIAGDVRSGDRRGRALGFPTANLYLDPCGGPDDGVWAATVAVAGRTHSAAVSLGHRSTYYGASGPRVLEANILDFDADIYGRRLIVVLRQFIRPQRRFDGSAALVRQLVADVATTRTWAASLESETRGARSVRASRTRRRIRSIEASGVAAPRARRRERLIAAAALDARERDHLTHEAIAEIAGVPLEFLRWAYPEVADLDAAAATSVTLSHPY